MGGLMTWLSAHAKFFAAAFGSAYLALYPTYHTHPWFIGVSAAAMALGVAGIPNTKV